MVEIFSFILRVEYDLSQWLLSDFGLILWSIFLHLVLASGSSSSINTHSSDKSFTHSPLVTSIIRLGFIYTFLRILIDSPSFDTSIDSFTYSPILTSVFILTHPSLTPSIRLSLPLSPFIHSSPLTPISTSPFSPHSSIHSFTHCIH